MYTFLKIEPDLYKHLITLYLRCFEIEIGIEDIEKKYNTSIFGVRDIGYLAMDEKNSPAAYYGVFPIIMNYNNSDVLVAQSGDTMTDPAHQKKGLFVQLAKKTYLLAKSVGIEMVFGFPNENSLPGFIKKLDWQFYGNMEKFEIRNLTIPFCELAYKYPFLKSFYSLYIKTTISKFVLNSLNVDLNPVHGSRIEIKKDDKYYTYKLRGINTFIVRVNGFQMIIKANNHLIIGDVAFFKKSDLFKFMSTIRYLGKILGSGKTILTINQNHWIYEYLVDVIPNSTSLPIGVLPLNQSSMNYEQICFTHSDYDTF